MKFRFMLFSTLAILLVFALGACSAANDPLAGTTWELSSYGGTPAMADAMVTAKFADGQVTGNGGCNGFGGEYQVDGDEISMNNVAITEMACLEPEGVMAQETAVMDYLWNAETFEINADGQLLIYHSDGEALVFVPAE